jgi:hypothetical protein
MTRIGDPSPKILSGKIVRDEPEAARMRISTETIETARDRHERCLSQLQDACLTLDSATERRDAGQSNARQFPQSNVE